jgi:hypothetical protein
MAEACKVCAKPVEAEPLVCAACGTTYHRSCRLGAGRCVTDGCKRGKGLEAKTAEQNRSALQMNAFPVVFGFFVGLAIGVPVGGFAGLPLLATAGIVLVIGLVAGGLAFQLWG